MRFAQLLIVAAVFAAVAGFRIKQRTKPVPEGRTPGQVTALFAMAPPGSASPPLENPRGGPCFPGFRSWTMQPRRFTTDVDLATTITGVLGYRHPQMAGLELNLKENASRILPCSPPQTETPNLPRGIPKILHDWQFYVDQSQGVSDILDDVSHVGIPTSFVFDRAEAAGMVAARGWELIGSAVDEGGYVYVGKQVSHLIQQPNTKACILTFQGTSSTQDWIANLNVKKSHFCGFVGQKERCDSATGDCVVAKSGESFVHQGFRDALRAMVQSADWQSDVKPKLSSCSELYVTGHSMGGAQAELFTACAQKAPQPGEYGYEEDYKYIEWTV